MGQKKTKMVSEASSQAEVVLVGCGCPLRGMGWYHAVQMLGGEVPSAKLSYIVEPWFMGPGMSKVTLLFMMEFHSNLFCESLSSCVCNRIMFHVFFISQGPTVLEDLSLPNSKSKQRRSMVSNSTLP